MDKSLNRGMLDKFESRKICVAGYQCDNSDFDFCIAERSGCVRLGNPDLDFQNLNPDFLIESEIRKQISPPRNPSSGWI